MAFPPQGGSAAALSVEGGTVPPGILDRWAWYIEGLHRHGKEVLRVPGEGDCWYEAVAAYQGRVIGQTTRDYLSRCSLELRCRVSDHVMARRKENPYAAWLVAFEHDTDEKAREYIKAHKIPCTGGQPGGQWAEDMHVVATLEMLNLRGRFWTHDEKEGARVYLELNHSSGSIIELDCYQATTHFNLVIQATPTGAKVARGGRRR